jgi:hypothetical protein
MKKVRVYKAQLPSSLGLGTISESVVLKADYDEARRLSDEFVDKLLSDIVNLKSCLEEERRNVDDWKNINEELQRESKRMTALLNKIAIMGAGELAYTKDYFEKVNQLVQEELTLRGTEPKRWLY